MNHAQPYCTIKEMVDGTSTHFRFFGGIREPLRCELREAFSTRPPGSAPIRSSQFSFSAKVASEVIGSCPNSRQE